MPSGPRDAAPGLCRPAHLKRLRRGGGNPHPGRAGVWFEVLERGHSRCFRVPDAPVVACESALAIEVQHGGCPLPATGQRPLHASIANRSPSLFFLVHAS